MFKSKVLDIKKQGNSLRIIAFSVPDNFSFIPGQYISILFNNTLRRPYSIASVPGKGSIRLLIKLNKGSKSSKAVYELKKGQVIEILGPLGKFMLNKKSVKKKIVFVSAGVGIAPFCSIIPFILKNRFKNKIFLIAGYRNAEDELCKAEFRNIKKRYLNFKYFPVFSNAPAKRKRGHVQDIIKKNIKMLENADFYICGMGEMVGSVKMLLVKSGVRNKDIYFEKY